MPNVGDEPMHIGNAGPEHEHVREQSGADEFGRITSNRVVAVRGLDDASVRKGHAVPPDAPGSIAISAYRGATASIWSITRVSAMSASTPSPMTSMGDSLVATASK